MTPNGWLQILFFLLAIFAGDAAPRRLHGPRVHAPAHLARPGAAAARAADLPADRRRRDARDALDRVRRRAAAVQRRLDAGAVRRCSGCRACCRSTRRASAPVAPDLAFNTAVSFTTNTNWQAYGGETTMSYFTQMAGLAYHNFVSAAVGIARRHRVHPRHRPEGEGHARQLLGRHGARHALGAAAVLPIVGALFLVSQGVVQNLKPYDTVAVVDPQTVDVDRRRRQAADDGRDASRRSRRARWRRRRSSSSSAPTAAASSTPTAPTRSRTRRRCRTSSRCSASSRSRPASPTRSAR